MKRWLNWTISFLGNQNGNLGKMFTPPKSKSPWEAMTAGSTGGWAGFAGPSTPTNPNDPKGWGWVGPALTGLMGATTPINPFAPLMSAGMGAAGMLGGGTGFQGTDKGWGNVGSTLLGGAGGYGAGALGAGVGGAMQGVATGGLGSAGSGLMGGLNQFASTPIIPGMGGTAPASWMAPAGGGVTSPYSMGQVTGSAAMGAGAGMVGAGAAGAAGAGGAGGAGSIFNLGNLSARTLGGAALLGASTLMKPPTVGTNRGQAMEAVNMPNLQEARGMMRDLAMMNPSELVNPASDEYVNAALRQSREAHSYQRKQTINDFATQGKTIGKSGALNDRLGRLDSAQTQRETDFISSAQEARYLAGMNMKVKTVQDYFNISQQEAADILAAYGYISPDDLLNFQSAAAGYQGAQSALGTAGGMLFS